MGRGFAVAAILIAGSVVVGCADLNSISRTTSLAMDRDHGKAIHLDAKQRLFVVNAVGEYCAEPNPDALAAYAAALGFGAGVPGTGSGALAAGQQASAASIGLRTQSITLMRDALYRMCEAYSNDALGAAQIATLLGRSQDLTAVILATEQLTGAVAANQVALTGSTTADASATALATSELLDAALANEERKERALEQAVAERDAAQANLQDAAGELEAAQARRNELETANAPAARVAEAEADVQFWQNERRRAQSTLQAAENRVELRRQALENARQTREAIQDNQDAATASAGAGTTSAAAFSTPGQRVELSKDATEAVADSVEEMVKTVLRKDYTEEACMVLITYFPDDFQIWSQDKRDHFQNLQRLCTDLLEQSISQRIETTFRETETTERIQRWLLDEPGNTARLSEYLRSQDFDAGVTALQFGDFESMRQRVVRHFNIR